MKHTRFEQKPLYRPLLFTIGAFSLTWLCVFALESTYIFEYEMPGVLVTLLDFVKSAAPLIAALLLLRKGTPEKGFFTRYIFGERKRLVNYGIVALLFLLQFFTFYLFRPKTETLTVPMFLSVFAGQLLFGGGLEEGGWRGYLLPALCTKMPFLLASAVTSVIWTVWHLPYFLIPGSSQYGSSFFAYLLVTILLGYLLSAIYLLTKSVLLCTLFHAFSNTVVMTLQADMGNLTLIAVFAVLALGAAALCQVLTVQARGR